MLKQFRNLFILYLIALIFFTYNVFTIAAGPEVPTREELSYAKQFLNIYTGLEKSDKRLQDQLKQHNISSLTPILTEKFNYTKNSYLQLSKMPPPIKFVNCHNVLIKALYKHL